MVDTITNQDIPYGRSATRRLVVPAVERMLYRPIFAGESQFVKVIDYMGGDAMVERVATSGHGAMIFVEQPEQSELFKHLVAKAIYNPFKSPQVKLHLQTSIHDALRIVYDQAASLNEYSGRYSVMIDSSFLATAEFIASRMEGADRNTALENARIAGKMLSENRHANYDRYKMLTGKALDFARELARTPLELNNDTTYIWKMDLLSLVRFIRDQRRMIGTKPHSMHAYLDVFEQIARSLSPNAVDALISDGKEIKLTYPHDEAVIDPLPLPATWKESETARVTVTALEELLFVKQPYLEHGGIQVVDYIGGDGAPVDGARMSYGLGTLKLRSDQKLLHLLYRADHASPFELAELAIEGKQPVFVSPRQAKRHRTLDSACFMDEFLLGSKYFLPCTSELKHQDRKNRQGRGNDLDDDLRTPVLEGLRQSYESQLAITTQLRILGVDEELIRGAKGVGFFTYEWRTGDLRNWCHFLGLRLDPHAQREIFQYAEIIADFVRRQSPTTYRALMDYKINGMRLSAHEKPLFAALLSLSPSMDTNNIDLYRPLGLVETNEDTLTGRITETISREGAELRQKLNVLLELQSDERTQQVILALKEEQRS